MMVILLLLLETGAWLWSKKLGEFMKFRSSFFLVH